MKRIMYSPSGGRGLPFVNGEPRPHVHPIQTGNPQVRQARDFTRMITSRSTLRSETHRDNEVREREKVWIVHSHVPWPELPSSAPQRLAYGAGKTPHPAF